MNAKSLMNLTPHNVDIFGDEGFIVTVQPSGTVARVAEVRESCSPVQIGTDISGFYIPVSRATYGAVQGLPDSDGETIYIVSALVLAQCAGRNDVFAPGPAVRNAAGQVVGCLGLSAAPAAAAAMTLGEFRVYIDVVGCLALGGHEWVDPAETARVYARIQAAPGAVERIADALDTAWLSGAQNGGPSGRPALLQEAAALLTGNA